MGGEPVETATRRPIGYWLKHLHNLLEEQLETTLAHHRVGRRHWQTLNSVAQHPHGEAELREALAPFWGQGEPALGPLLDDLTERGWVVRQPDTDALALTDRGAAVHAELTRHVQRTRALLLTGVSPERYTDTVHTLATMAGNVERALAEERSKSA
ncbi:MarR family winged helix-turn-helix transcriptional regulator [Streptomyces triticirhizae]|uniref:MarR family transcriptional regulator n=1 Tax=Streptomyces triticirhizae TaxID=2483353 RepID=A0A3M2M0N4_9ACTN|nr:winged helix DNA-binding protein [Streptomyces triticirhizae]RMI43211.1 MarR family transcriptional regulator [Streptomyces triticirhizae]